MNREKIIQLAKECGIYLEIPKQLEVFYHAAIANFLKESGQYVTNDASREAVIKQAKAEAFEDAAKFIERTKHGSLNDYPIYLQYATQLCLTYAESIREMAKEKQNAN